MNIIRIDKNNQVNGDGLRCVVWLAGCKHKCPGCHNPETWNFNCGHKINEDDLEVIYSQLNKEEISGLTITGGDPLFQDEKLALFLKEIKLKFPNKVVWCYTGFTLSEVLCCKSLDYIDVLVDGPYKQELNPGPGKILWRGSTNQRIIDLNKTRRCGEIVLLYD